MRQGLTPGHIASHRQCQVRTSGMPTLEKISEIISPCPLKVLFRNGKSETPKRGNGLGAWTQDMYRVNC